jgi:hypothetical protein
LKDIYLNSFNAKEREEERGREMMIERTHKRDEGIWEKSRKEVKEIKKQRKGRTGD